MTDAKASAGDEDPLKAGYHEARIIFQSAEGDEDTATLTRALAVVESALSGPASASRHIMVKAYVLQGGNFALVLVFAHEQTIHSTRTQHTCRDTAKIE